MKTIMDFELIFVARDAYKSGFDNARKTFEAEKQKAAQDYKGARLSEELNAAQDRFNNSLTALKERISSEVNAAVAKGEATAKARVTDKAIDYTLKHLMDIPLSKTEFEIYAEKYAGSHYLNDKMLLMIAEKNNISTDMKILPPVDEQLLVLKEIEQEFERMYEIYDGDSFKSFSILSDSVIVKWENRFYGNAEMKLPPEKQAQRAYTTIMGKTDELSKGSALRNAIKTFGVDSEATQFLLSKIAKEDKLNDVALHYAGQYCMNMVADYKAGKKPFPEEKTATAKDDKKEAEMKAWKETGKALSSMAASKS